MGTELVDPELLDNPPDLELAWSDCSEPGKVLFYRRKSRELVIHLKMKRARVKLPYIHFIIETTTLKVCRKRPSTRIIVIELQLNLSEKAKNLTFCTRLGDGTMIVDIGNNGFFEQLT